MKTVVQHASRSGNFVHIIVPYQNTQTSEWITKINILTFIVNNYNYIRNTKVALSAANQYSN